MRCFYTFINQLKSFYYKLLACSSKQDEKIAAALVTHLVLYAVIMNGYSV